MSLPSPDIVRRIEDAAAALIATGTPNPTNDQVRRHLGGGSLLHISPVMRAFRARAREQATGETPVLPPALAQLLTGQLAILWQAAWQRAEADTQGAREQAECDRLLDEVRELRAAALPLHEQVARLTTTTEHLTAQLQETKAELKTARTETQTLQAELLTLARGEPKGGKGTK